MTKCPVCDGEMRRVDVPKHEVWVCDPCEEMVQRQGDGSLILLGKFLERSSLGDDRVKAAISKPVVTTMRGMIDVFEDISFRFSMDLASAGAGFNSVIVRIQNRLDYAIGQLSGLDFANDDVGAALEALREVRALVMPRNKEGIRETFDTASS